MSLPPHFGCPSVNDSAEAVVVRETASPFLLLKATDLPCSAPSRAERGLNKRERGKGHGVILDHGRGG